MTRPRGSDPAPRRHHATVSLVVGALTATLAACSGAPDPGPTATALAEAVESGDFTQVPWAGVAAADVTAEAADIVEGMGDIARSVEVRRIEDRDDDRVVTVEVTWDLDESDEDWTYSTTARLVPDADRWAVEWEPTILHPELTAGARLELSTTQPGRADILGAGGSTLVTERPVHRIGLDKTRVDAAALASSATALATLVGVDPAGYADRVAGAGPRAFVEAITLRADAAEPVLAQLSDIPGAIAIDDTLPLAPTREFARPLLGTVGEATAEIIEQSGGRIRPGEVVGLSGLHQQYDEQLRGRRGITVELISSAEPMTLLEREPVPGTPVITTVDIDLQTRAETILTGVESPSAIVAIQASTGAVLAAASGPGSEGYSTATLGRYAPGSTFKVVTSLALLRAGLTPSTPVSCPPTITVDGRDFRNYSDYPANHVGEIPLHLAFAHSCNTAFIGQRDSASPAALVDAATALGLGTDHDPGVPAFLGSVPAEADGTALAAAVIGQGNVLASPLAMATVAASVARGATVTPRIVETSAGPAPSGSGSLTSEEAATLAQLMRAVVEDGSGRFLRDVPGDPVRAKTGTAEYRSDSTLGTHAWMIATQGDLAVAVFVEDGESGAQTAGPLLEEFLR